MCFIPQAYVFAIFLRKARLICFQNPMCASYNINNDEEICELFGELQSLTTPGFLSELNGSSWFATCNCNEIVSDQTNVAQLYNLCLISRVLQYAFTRQSHEIDCSTDQPSKRLILSMFPRFFTWHRQLDYNESFFRYLVNYAVIIMRMRRTFLIHCSLSFIGQSLSFPN